MANLADLVGAVIVEADVPKDVAIKAVEAVFEKLTDDLRLGRESRLAGFGTFYVQETSARETRDPRTGELITALPSRHARFRPDKKLADAVGSFG